MQKDNATLRKQLKDVNSSLTVLIEHVSAYNMKKKTIAQFDASTYNEMKSLDQSLKMSRASGLFSPRASNMSALVSPKSSIHTHRGLLNSPSPSKKLVQIEELHQENMKKQ